MTLKFHKSHSTVEPPQIDETSSKTSVYIRKNITEQQITNEETGETTVQFEYDEAILSKDEYARYLDKLDTEAMIAELAEAMFSE